MCQSCQNCRVMICSEVLLLLIAIPRKYRLSHKNFPVLNPNIFRSTYPSKTNKKYFKSLVMYLLNKQQFDQIEQRK